MRSGVSRPPSPAARPPHGCALLVRRDVETAAKLLDAFAHAGDADAASAAHDVLERGASECHVPDPRSPAPGLRVGPQTNVGGLTARVAMNVGQRLLNDPKERRLRVARQPLETLGQIEVHFDAAALGKPAGVPSQRRQQARFVEKRRVKQIGQRPDFGHRLLRQRDALGQRAPIVFAQVARSSDSVGLDTSSARRDPGRSFRAASERFAAVRRLARASAAR